jgi:hypothetical protein
MSDLQPQVFNPHTGKPETDLGKIANAYRRWRDQADDHARESVADYYAERTRLNRLSAIRFCKRARIARLAYHAAWLEYTDQYDPRHLMAAE